MAFIEDEGLLIALDRFQNNDHGDGIVDELFLLQIKTWDGAPEQLSRRATLLLKPDSLAVNSQDLGMGWEVFLEDRREDMQRARLQNASQTHEITGYGLARYGVSGLALEMQHITAEVNAFVAACDGFCDSGGPGSVSCSIGGCLVYPYTCSITCSKGYNACCRCMGALLRSCCKCYAC